MEERVLGMGGVFYYYYCLSSEIRYEELNILDLREKGEKSPFS